MDIEVYKGDSFTRVISFKDDQNAAINISGYTIYFTVKEEAGVADTAAKLEVTIESEDISEPENGEVAIAVSAADMASKIEAGSYYYDIKYKKPDGTVFTALAGKFTVNEAITLRASAA